MLHLIKRDLIFIKIIFPIVFLVVELLSILLNMVGLSIYFEIKIIGIGLILLLGSWVCVIEQESKYKKVPELLVTVGYSKELQVMERYVLAIGIFILEMINECIIEIFLTIVYKKTFYFTLMGTMNAIIFMMLVINFCMILSYSTDRVGAVVLCILFIQHFFLKLFEIKLDFLMDLKGVGIFLIIPIIIITIISFKFCVYLYEKKMNKEW